MPPVTQSLLIANVVVFLLQTQTGNALEYWFALWPLSHGFAPWQLVTYGFLHGGFAPRRRGVVRCWSCSR